MRFTVDAIAAGSSARAATLRTATTTVATPAFMPVGTRGSVRTQAPSQVAALGARMLLANTYHLVQRPGLDVLRRVGGLARWIGWDGAILTDSGGFQVYSLAHACTIDDAGARFRPHRDGPIVTLTPESAIAAQEVIGSDVMMVLDQCVATTSDRATTAAAMARTHAWARRSLAARTGDRALFAIVQGGGFADLRRESADALLGLDRKDFWDPAPGLGLLRGRKFDALLRRVLPVTSFAACAQPVFISVFDIGRRATRVVTDGDLPTAIRASCAVPGMFHPVVVDGRACWDGGILDRPGLVGMPAGRTLFHHIASRSPWRRRGSAALALPSRPELISLVIDKLPRSGPFKLEAGRAALAAARAATARALDQPIADGAVALAA